MYRIQNAVVGLVVTRRRQSNDETEPTEAFQKPRAATLTPDSVDGNDQAGTAASPHLKPTTTPESNCIHA